MSHSAFGKRLPLERGQPLEKGMWGPQARKVVKGRPLEKGKGKPLEKSKEGEKGKGKPLGKGKEEEKGKGKPLGKGKEEEEEEEEEGEWVWKPFLGKYRWVKPDHQDVQEGWGWDYKRRAGRVDKQWSSLAEQNSPETVEGLEEQKEKLQKALDQAVKRLELRKQEEFFSSSESTKPSKKSGKLGPRLGEVKEEDPPDWSAMEEIQDFSCSLWTGATPWRSRTSCQTTIERPWERP